MLHVLANFLMVRLILPKMSSQHSSNSGSDQSYPTIRPPIDGSKKRRGMRGALEKTFNNEEARDHLTGEIARFIYSAGLPFNVVRNPHFISALSYAANTSFSDFLPPSCNAIRTTCMEREKADILKMLQIFKSTWPEKGVSIVIDGWVDSQRRPLINFMAVSLRFKTYAFEGC